MIYTIKNSPATPCPYCGGRQEGQCVDQDATRDCGMFRVAHGYSPAVHFVGFRDDSYWNAVRVWGLPDFIHLGWDLRAQRDVADGDLVVFATGDADQVPHVRSFDDSNQRDDPAYWERLNRPMPKK